MMNDFIHNYARFFAPISSTLVAGVKLDYILHFLVGAIVTILLLKLTKLQFSLIFLIVLFLELTKEFFDSFILSSTLGGHLIDIICTMLYPTAYYYIKKFKESSF